MIDGDTQVVSLAHYTVQQSFLKPEESFFHFFIDDANQMVGDFCIAYLSISNFETRMTTYKENSNTDIMALEKLASHGALIASDHPGVIGVLGLECYMRTQYFAGKANFSSLCSQIEIEDSGFSLIYAPGICYHSLASAHCLLLQLA